MILRPPRLTRTDTLFPYPTLFRSPAGRHGRSRHVAVPAIGPARTHLFDSATFPVTNPERLPETLFEPAFRSKGWALPRQRGIGGVRSEEHTSELQSLMRISYAVFCLKKKKTTTHKL